MLKKTEYFLSELGGVHNIQHCVNQAVDKREIFLKKNTLSIASIDEEDIKVITNTNQTICVIIQLSYYPKVTEE